MRTASVPAPTPSAAPTSARELPDTHTERAPRLPAAPREASAAKTLPEYLKLGATN